MFCFVFRVEDKSWRDTSLDKKETTQMGPASGGLDGLLEEPVASPLRGSKLPCWQADPQGFPLNHHRPCHKSHVFR